MTRVNSVTSTLKRLFSKEDGKGDGKDSKSNSRVNSSVELTQMGSSVTKSQQGSKRITDEVIEEVSDINCCFVGK